LRTFLAEKDPVLSIEAVRSLAARNVPEAHAVLAEVAADESRDAELRAEAVVGLSASAEPAHQATLVKLATHQDTAIRNEALRALRLSTLDDTAKKSISDAAPSHPESAALTKALLDPASINLGRPAFEDTAAWLHRLEAVPGKADAAAGRRIFFHPRLAICATCHRHSGRGNVVGPDLSLSARQGDLKATLQSILEPSREVAPQFFPTLLELKDGTSFTGILLRSSNREVFRDLTGKERSYFITDIAKREELMTSLMPPGLVAMLTDQEVRDLLAFLRDGAPR
jgi:putative heme-binding domain-containing protein